MRRIRIYLFSILFIFFIALIPWVSGNIFKYQYLKLIDVINKGKQIQIDLVKYRQGWLNSEAVIQVKLVDPSLLKNAIIAQSPLIVTLEEFISHGPIVYTHLTNQFQLGYASVHTVIQLPCPLQEKLFGKQELIGLIQVDTLLKGSGHWLAQLHIPVLLFSIPQFNIAWFGLDGSCKLKIKNEHIKDIVTTMKTGALTIHNQMPNFNLQQLIVSPFKYSSDWSHQSNGLWSGSSTIFFPQIIYKKTNGIIYSIDRVVFNNTFSISPDIFYNMVFNFKFKNLSLPDNDLPHINAFNMMTKANNFSSTGFSEYIDFIKTNFPQSLTSINYPLLQNLVLHTITPNSLLEIDAKADTVLGGLSSLANMHWQPDAPIPVNFSDAIKESYITARMRVANVLLSKLFTIYGKDLLNMGPTPAINEVSSASPQPKTSEASTLEAAMNTQLAYYLRTGRITIQQSIQIINYEKLHQPPAVFAANITSLKLPTDVTNQLKLTYELHVNNYSKRLAAASDQLLDEMVLAGVLTKDNSDFLTVLTLGDSVLKLNGWTVSNP